jgi:hypothetical protein
MNFCIVKKLFLTISTDDVPKNGKISCTYVLGHSAVGLIN